MRGAVVAATTASWNSLEIVKLIVSLLVPIAVVFLGLIVARTTKRIEAAQWLNQKLVEKRILFVEAVTPVLNDLYCYYRWIGNWKELSPPDVLQRKRQLDRLFHTNRPFLASTAMQSYDAFSRVLFQTYSAPGKDALLRTAINSHDGNRASAYAGGWDPKWDGMFAAEADLAKRSDISAHYDELIRHLAAEVGVHAEAAPDGKSAAKAAGPDHALSAHRSAPRTPPTATP